jgi:hypothetical protein
VDPSVEEARREGTNPVGLGTAFDLVSRFGGRKLALRYSIVDYNPPQSVTLEAIRPSFTSSDTISVAATAEGSAVHYEASLRFHGFGRILDPVMQLVFSRLGNQATAGLTYALNHPTTEPVG